MGEGPLAVSGARADEGHGGAARATACSEEDEGCGGETRKVPGWIIKWLQARKKQVGWLCARVGDARLACDGSACDRPSASAGAPALNVSLY